MAQAMGSTDVRVYTVEQVARMLDAGNSTIYRMIARGTFPTPIHKIGGIRILADPFDRYLETGQRPDEPVRSAAAQ